MNNNNRVQSTVPASGFPTPVVNRFRTGDIDEHSRNMGGWQLCYDQLTPGRFEGDLVEFRADWMQLVRDRSNQAMTKQGAAWEGAITFSLPLNADGPAFCSGHPIAEPSLLVARGQNLPELCTPAHLDLFAFALDEQTLEHMLERQGSRFQITDLPKCYRLGDSMLPAEVAMVFNELEGCAQGRDSMLGYESIRRGLRDTVMVQVLELVAPDEAPPLNPTARKRMVDRAREYAMAHVDEPLSILDLCNHIGASRRKLQYCFQETLGINPVAYLRALRLNAVRRELRNDDQVQSVQEVAARWGFWHLSRFSSDYRVLFGETPSQTLRRTHLC
ncbi:MULTISPECIES: helix-turn-helix domain-containing protein [unclassified Pseudomonas]|uniref:helix-turn-helix domain-containing protein n=1 Tax=unclassified Pseudomonas TaxID=196821 RepID=UPI00119C8A54|nr:MULTISPECIES: helix-turn-helix domain-containing protein [unclassified Pseudomonas]TWC15500.1 AraC family transcriptional regulator [Pseudomonas sp. SJZ075]TWC19080.1 AraC family transcriptional regulator [Pseudomonas sp. SJZ074]TWC30454.1 AraC family transcriptional regulator [Pseudomonas sp. SJZ078]TWC36904.1 AraC family transcriptional regulator [Pseudomonas sp. SJZ085]TWC53145.1 AraC family transcriptional regulator [Pseudomonas sp. SJZ124]